MKLLLTFLFFLVSLNSICQRPDKSDSINYETYTYIERIDSSDLPWQTKNKLEYAKLKPYIQNDPKSAYSFQCVQMCRYLDTATVDSIYNLYDTSIQKLIIGIMNAMKIRAKLNAGDLFPELMLTDSSKHEAKISDWKGKIVLIDVWASWCTPCRKQMPKLKALFEKFKDKGLTVIAISYDKDKEKWSKAIKEDALPWLHYCDFVEYDQNKLWIDWGVDSIPYNFLINKDGKLIGKALTMGELEKALIKL